MDFFLSAKLHHGACAKFSFILEKFSLPYGQPSANGKCYICTVYLVGGLTQTFVFENIYYINIYDSTYVQSVYREYLQS